MKEAERVLKIDSAVLGIEDATVSGLREGGDGLAVARGLWNQPGSPAGDDGHGRDGRSPDSNIQDLPQS